MGRIPKGAVVRKGEVKESETSTAIEGLGG